VEFGFGRRRPDAEIAIAQSHPFDVRRVVHESKSRR
jgi:hypothetical protein